MYLQTSDRSLEIGENNRAFILDLDDASTTWSAHYHNYLGGSVAFDVNVSDVGCGCAAGVYLTTSNDETCNWSDYDANVTPQCTTIDLVEANMWGFRAGYMPCMDGSCNAAAKCSSSVTSDYGPTGIEAIDTMKSYNVKTSFWVDQNVDGLYTDLQRIETVLSQHGLSITITQECENVADLTELLADQMLAMGVSTTIIGSPNEVSGSCATECASAKSIISNVVWTEGDAVNEYVEPAPEPEVDEKIDQGAAPTLNEAGCGSDCTECRAFYWTSDPQTTFYECVDRTIYRYVNHCSGAPSDHPKCMTNDVYCLGAYPFGSSTADPEYQCRTVPEYLRGLATGAEFEYKGKSFGGLCSIDCPGNRNCFPSWRRDDPLGRSGHSYMPRCRNY